MKHTLCALGRFLILLHIVFAFGLLQYPFQAYALRNVYFIAPWRGDMFSKTSPDNRDNSLGPMWALKQALQEHDFSVHQISHPAQAKDPYRVIWFDLIPSMAVLTDLLPPELQILFIWEPRVMLGTSYDTRLHRNFSAVYTWDNSLINASSAHTTYKKFYYPQLRNPISESPSYHERMLLTMIHRYLFCNVPGELKSERLRAARFFEEYAPDEFHLYGMGWPKHLFPSYRGSVKAKEEVLPHYRFIICYENTNAQEGYVSEKILDAFYTRCVPIYLGAPNIQEYVPEECFIDARNFASYQELLHFIRNVDEAQFQAYLSAAEAFCNSEQGHTFSTQKFIEIVLEALE